jgi:predicted glycosyltransferase involved in capsule biosynthesis
VLLPHLTTYFARDKADKHIPVFVVAVEQAPGLPFNRGLINNIGYQIVRGECDYVCFHDVDCLPIWADYSCPDFPTMLLWSGFERTQMDPENPKLGYVKHDLEIAFSAVILSKNEHFERVDGFANDYWGWGYEDIKLNAANARRLEEDGEADYYRCV